MRNEVRAQPAHAARAPNAYAARANFAVASIFQHLYQHGPASAGFSAGDMVALADACPAGAEAEGPLLAVLRHACGAMTLEALATTIGSPAGGDQPPTGVFQLPVVSRGNALQALARHPLVAEGPAPATTRISDITDAAATSATLASLLTAPLAVLRSATEARSLADAVSCVGTPANPRHAASGIHAIGTNWQKIAIHLLCTNPHTETHIQRAPDAVTAMLSTLGDAPAADLQRAMTIQNVQGFIAAVGAPATAQRPASGIVALEEQWRPVVLDVLCRRLAGIRRPPGVAVMSAARDPHILAAAYADLIGMHDIQDSPLGSGSPLPPAEQSAIINALVAHADAWAATFNDVNCTHSLLQGERAGHTAARALAPCLQALVSGVDSPTREHLLSTLRQRVDSGMDAPMHAILTHTSQRNASWHVLADMLVSMVLNEPDTHAILLRMYGPFSSPRREDLLERLHSTAATQGLPVPHAATLVQCFGVTDSDLHRFRDGARSRASQPRAELALGMQLRMHLGTLMQEMHDLPPSMRIIEMDPGRPMVFIDASLGTPQSSMQEGSIRTHARTGTSRLYRLWSWVTRRHCAR